MVAWINLKERTADDSDFQKDTRIAVGYGGVFAVGHGVNHYMPIAQ
jgi:hypothetical protein